MQLIHTNMNMNPLKTLKTRLFEGVLNYLCDRNLHPYINVNWQVLDLLDGKLEIEREHENIVLDISTKAVRDFSIDGNIIIFHSKFDGVATQCFVPTAAVVAVYDKVSGQGMAFDVNVDLRAELEEYPDEGQTEPEAPKPKGKPVLTVVK